jgi:hydroxymethylbilane synthase
MPSLPIRIATRASPLALAQAEMVAAALRGRHGLAPGDVVLVKITTSGDRVRDLRLAEVGGKGLFTKEIEEALLGGTADIAVHSMKDVETHLPDGLDIAALMEREDPRDVLISSMAAPSIRALPDGARLGTSSLRRGAIARSLRPDLEIVTLRGNVGTRLARLDEGVADATLLARAGLNRLGLEPANGFTIEIEEMLPAVAQGAIGIEIREGDTATRDLVAPLGHEPTRIAVTAERALLAALDGSCRTPIAALATQRGTELDLRALIARPDGSRVVRAGERGPASEPARLGEIVARRLLASAGPGFLDR